MQTAQRSRKITIPVSEQEKLELEEYCNKRRQSINVVIRDLIYQAILKGRN